MKKRYFLSLITVTGLNQCFAIERIEPHPLNVQNLNPVTDAFTGTISSVDKFSIKGMVSHISVYPIEIDSKGASHKEMARFSDKYDITIIIGNVIFTGKEQNVLLLEKSDLALWGDQYNLNYSININYASSREAITDAASFETALKQLLNFYDGCPTPPAQFL